MLLETCHTLNMTHIHLLRQLEISETNRKAKKIASVYSILQVQKNMEKQADILMGTYDSPHLTSNVAGMNILKFLESFSPNSK
jgi:hypothetical protein